MIYAQKINKVKTYQERRKNVIYNRKKGNSVTSIELPPSGIYQTLPQTGKCDTMLLKGRSGHRIVAQMRLTFPKITLVGLVWFVGFYGISNFVGYLTPNPFLCKSSVLFKTIQFSISTQFNCQKHFYFKLFRQLMSKNSSI